MISWIQKSFQKHFRVIFALILISTIISFIIAFGPGSNLGNSERQTIARPFFGYNLGSQEDQARIIGDANLSVYVQAGYAALDSDKLQQYAFQRTAALALADKLHVPPTTPEEITAYIKNLRAFTGENGQFDAQHYAAFRDSLKGNPRMTEADVSRVIADNIRSDKVQKIIAGPGYVLPADVKAELDRADSTWTIATATASYASFNPPINVTDAALAKYFTQESARYTIAPRVVTSMALFPASAYIGSINVSEADIRAYYDANPGRFPNPAAKPVTAKPDATANYAAVRPQVEAALRLERAQRVAAKTASDFSFAIYDSKATPGTPEFDRLLAERHITLKPLAPFTREDGPAELGHSQEVAAEAFKLGTARAYSDALTVPGGAAVLFWKETLPSRQPLLAEVHDRVLADYKANEKSKLFVEFGRTLRSLIENRLKAGESFDKAVATAASATSVKIETKTLPAFTRRAPPQDIDDAVAGAIDRLSKGQISDMVISPDHGLFVYVVDKKVPDLSETSPGYAAMRVRMAATNASIDASTQLAALVDQELKKSEPAVVR